MTSSNSDNIRVEHVTIILPIILSKFCGALEFNVGKLKRRYLEHHSAGRRSWNMALFSKFLKLHE
jgi:CBS domain containing-hemolysin-like protein